MEGRVAKLEEFAQDTRERLTRIETKLDSSATKGDIVGTKADIADAKAEIIKWMVGTAVGLGVAAITVITFVLNNATPKAAPTAQQAPIIINVPAAPPPVQTAPAAATTAPATHNP